ncbi:hypothetical protein Tco_1504327, partial [Tanacetum coccineum]
MSLVGPAGDLWDQRVRSQLIDKDLVSGLLVYELPLSSLRKKYCLSLKNDMPPRDKISFDESDDEDYTNEFPAIVYNDAVTSKSYFITEPTLNPQHIDEFDLKDETSLSEYDEVEQNVLYFNDLFPFNIIYLDDLKSDKDNDDNEIDIVRSSEGGGNVNTQGSNKLLKASHDKSNKIFITESFIMELDVNIMTWNYLNNEMLFNLIKNLYAPFGIPFDPKRYYKDGGCTRKLRRPRIKPGIIMEYLVKISLKARILELKRRHLKIIVLTSNTL